MRVSNNGISIGEEQLDCFFNLYQRLSQEVDGLGVGLYLVKKIMDASGGSVRLLVNMEKGQLLPYSLSNEDE